MFHAIVNPFTPDNLPERPGRPLLPMHTPPARAPALFFQNRSTGLSNPILFGSTPMEQDNLPDNDELHQYTPAEWLFLTDVICYFKGTEDL